MAQEFISALEQLVAEHNAGSAVDYKQEVKPVKEFHSHRHSKLTPHQNVSVDEHCTMIVMVKTKGRGK